MIKNNAVFLMPHFFALIPIRAGMHTVWYIYESN